MGSAWTIACCWDSIRCLPRAGRGVGSTSIFRAWAVPSPGRKSAALPDVADAVVSFARKTFGNQRFAVLGNSFGGMIARHLVAEFGDQVIGLALLCPVAVAEHGRRRCRPGRYCTPIRISWLRWTRRTRRRTRRWRSSSPRRTGPVSATPHCRGCGHLTARPSAGLPDAIRWPSSPRNALPNFGRRPLVIAGRQDHVVGFEDQMASGGTLRGFAQFRSSKSAGHNAHLDQPELTRRAARSVARAHGTCIPVGTRAAG